MGLAETVRVLDKHGDLLRIRAEIDPSGELSEIQRRAYAKKAPALLFEKVRGTHFPVLGNIFGTKARAKLILGSSLDRAKEAIDLKADPIGQARALIRQPTRAITAPWTGLCSLPKKIPLRSALVCRNQTRLSELPHIIHSPDDGGAYITLPQVLTRDPSQPKILKANVGMYRIQMSGNDYITDKECGLHYQIHRGIGIHHEAALRQNQPLKVSIFVGGHPGHALAAVMPLPEGLSELLMAGMLSGRRFRYAEDNGFVYSADADFCITGEILTGKLKPEGPFGDHLGYYSLKHDFPVMRIHQIFHRDEAIWPFTVVGRPPQEDTTFGEIIHEITESMVPVSLPGVKALHAVDAAGVHPLLLALGSERYVPYDQELRPRELLTQANAILGFNQCSLAKYLMIAAQQDNHALNVNAIDEFLIHILQRVDWGRDLHFQTCTTMDTLDYSGTALNEGSKLIIAAAGRVRRQLTIQLPENFNLPEDFRNPKIILPGVLVIEGPAFKQPTSAQSDMQNLISVLNRQQHEGLAWIIVADDSAFCAANLNNFLWVTFTRSDPAADTYGVHESINNKHWGCHGPLVTDARIKPHHAPPIREDTKTMEKVDTLCRKIPELRNLD